MHLLIDADSALYRAGCANEERTYRCTLEGQLLEEFRYKSDAKVFAEEYGCEIVKHKTAGPIGLSLHNLRQCAKNFFAIEHDSYEMFIGGKGNFRYDYYPEYKNNRDGDDKPVHLEQMKKHLQAQYGAVRINDEEADDVVSYKQCMAEKDSTCIVTIDKDLNNTAGWHYNWVKGDMFYVTEKEADLNFARQLLSGDATDGIPGLKGVAAKTAIKLLPEYRDDWLEFVKHTYLERGYTLDYLNQMGIMLYMRKKPEEIWSCE
jgi:hypothetical protein